MKTLSQSITSAFYQSPFGFTELERVWKEICLTQLKELTVADHLLYAVLRGKDYTKGFGKTTEDKWKYIRSQLWSTLHNDRLGLYYQIKDHDAIINLIPKQVGEEYVCIPVHTE